MKAPRGFDAYFCPQSDVAECLKVARSNAKALPLGPQKEAALAKVRSLEREVNRKGMTIRIARSYFGGAV